MTRYILHYATIDDEGRLSIDCHGPFKTMEDALIQQEALFQDFRDKHLCYSASQIEECCGTFRRIAYSGQLTEIQSHIKPIEL